MNFHFNKGPFLTSRLYWKCRHIFLSIKLWKSIKLYNSENFAHEASRNTKTLNSLIYATLNDLIICLVFATILQYTNPFTTDILREIGIYIPRSVPYESLLTTIIALGGVFIGLYYTATSAIASSSYSRAPAQVRTILATERTGSVYMRFLSKVTIIYVISLIFYILGHNPITLLVPLTFVLAGLAISAFVALGSSAFRLFDPTKLSVYPIERLVRLSKIVSVNGTNWADPLFQEHAHRLARSELKAISAIGDMAASEPHLRNSSYRTFCTQLLRFLREYEPIKCTIPSTSKWFSQRYQHPYWYKTPDYSASILHQTGALPDPKKIPENNWVEDALLPIVWDCIEKNISDNRFDVANDLLNHLDTYVSTLASQHQILSALALVRKAFSVCEPFLFDHTSSEDKNLEKLALADNISRIAITALLSYLEAISDLNRTTIQNACEKTDWTNFKSINKLPFPAFTHEDAEWLYERIKREKHIEGHIITPSWYCAEIFTLKISHQAKQCLNALYDEAFAIFKAHVDLAHSQKQYLVAASVLKRADEYSKKSDAHFSTFQKYWKSLTDDKKLSTLPWPNIEFDLLHNNISQHNSYIMDNMADSALYLSIEKRTDNLPDLAGKFLHSTAEYLVDAIFSQDTKFIEKHFSKYFFSSLQQFDHLRPQLGSDPKHPQFQLDVKLAAAPLLDLMDVSGYAYLVSIAFQNEDIFEPVKTAWNARLNEHDREESIPFVKLLGTCLAISESSFGISHRSIIRQSWNGRLVDLSDSLPKKTRDLHHGIISEEYVDHDSSLVRAVCNFRHYSRFDGIDIFIYAFLSKQSDFDSTVFQRRVDRGLAHSIDREEEYRKHQDGEEDDA